jgi:GcrA cell cycle regulator
MTSYDWTPESIALLERLWAEGHTCTEIARRMGISKGAVAGKVFRLGLTQRGAVCGSEPKPVSEAQRSIIRNHWHRGRLKDIETYTGLDHRRIKKIAAEMGLPPRSRGMVPRPAARARQELPCSVQRAASPLRPSAATISGVSSSAVERLGTSPQVENLPEAVAETPPPRVFSGTQCCYVIGDRTCDEPVRANARGLKSPYCPEHFALIYAAAPAKSANNPPPAGWLKNRLAMRARG